MCRRVRYVALPSISPRQFAHANGPGGWPAPHKLHLHAIGRRKRENYNRGDGRLIALVVFFFLLSFNLMSFFSLGGPPAGPVLGAPRCGVRLMQPWICEVWRLGGGIGSPNGIKCLLVKYQYFSVTPQLCLLFGFDIMTKPGN